MSTQITYNVCLGKWQNSYDESESIAGFELYLEDGKLYIDIEGVEGGNMPGQWGAKEVLPFIHKKNSSEATAFHVVYDLPFGKTSLAINENKGLFVIISFIEAADKEIKKNYYIREFFIKV